MLATTNDAGGVQFRPDSDYWYQHQGYQTATGLRVSPESAMRVAAVYACVRVISETVASLPLVIYRRLPNGGKEVAVNHPLGPVLGKQPNLWQTAYEFWEMMEGHLELRGNAFARKVAGPNGPIDQIIPLHPDRVSVYRLPNGKLQYQVRYLYTAKVDIYVQEEIFHLRGLSSDGLVGLSPIGIGAETIGVGLAAQEFAGRFFENDATPGGVMIHPKTLTKGAHARIKDSWREYFSGSNQHGVAVLEEGMTYQNIGLTNKDSQLLEARQFSRGDIASMFRVPPHKIGDLSRATFSNIEQQNIEFATDSVRPRLVRLERKINCDLIDMLDLGDGNEYFAEFQMDALMRGDLKSRYEAYSVGILAGFITRNEARAEENKNPIDGLDTPLMPLNMATVDINGNPVLPAQATPEDPANDTGLGAKNVRTKRLEMFVDVAIERVLRKELGELTKCVKRSENMGVMHAEFDAFYSGYRGYLQSNMHISKSAADLYIWHNRRLLADCQSRAQVKVTLELIEQKAPQMLMELAMPVLLETQRKVRVLEEFNGGEGDAISARDNGSDENAVGDSAREIAGDSRPALAKSGRR